MTTVLVIVLAGIGTVAASAGALPNESLYSVKLATEQARVTLAFSNINKAELHIRFAERRADEMVEMARQGKSDKIPMLTEQVAKHLDNVCMAEETKKVKEVTPRLLVPPTPAPSPASGTETYDGGKGAEELEIVLSQSRAKSLDALGDALDKAPEKLKPVVERAMVNITKDYDRAISIVETGSNP